MNKSMVEMNFWFTPGCVHLGYNRGDRIHTPRYKITSPARKARLVAIARGLGLVSLEGGEQFVDQAVLDSLGRPV